jgi:hypothetical protein
MDIIENIKAKLSAAFEYGEINGIHAVIKFDFKDGEMLSEEEEVELIQLIKHYIKPERVYVCCNRNYKEKNLPWSAFLHLHGFVVEGDFTVIFLRGFNVRK